MASDVEFERPAVAYPVKVSVQPVLEGRNRVTAAFRFFLALPHLILVGGPIAVISTIGWSTEHGHDVGFGSGGLLSAVACVLAVFAWFAIVFTGRHPESLWKLATWYLAWRVRAVVYMTLLRDEYPPFGEGTYPAELQMEQPEGERNRVTVFFRLLLAIPHLLVLWLLSLVWAFTTAIAWLFILVTGRYPETLYGFAMGVLSWSVRVEAYVLLLRDEYPPFTLRA